MTIGWLTDMVESMPQTGRLLGMDVGQKTIGLAVCDVTHKLVTPVATIKRTKFTKDIKKIKEVIDQYDVTGFVVGLPLHMDGREGRRAQSVRDFVAELSRYGDIVGDNPWISFVDERLSTNAVEQFVDHSMDINRRQAKTRGITDQLAAVHILEEAMAVMAGFCKK